MRKAASVAVGLVSPRKFSRVRSSERLLAYFLRSMPDRDIVEHLQYGERLPDDALAGARLYADREAMLQAIPKHGRVAELGTWRGDFAKRIAEVCAPSELHLIDIDTRPLDREGVACALGSGRLFVHQADSASGLRTLGQGCFDLVYIDADHSYKAVRRDLQAAAEALRPGGYLMCNDYTNWCSPSMVPYGVARAVDEFVIAAGYRVDGLALHPAGLHDLLLRKPG